MTPAYELICDTFRLSDDDLDCRIERARNATAVTWCGRSPPDLDTVIVIGDSTRLSTADFPANQLAWPVVSRALWVALGQPGSTVPVVAREAVDSPEVLAGRFLVFHLRPTEGLLDLRASRWEEDSVFPGEVGLIRELRFRAGVTLPAVFRLAEAPGRLFVSRRRRIRLMDSATVGVRFQPVGGG